MKFDSLAERRRAIITRLEMAKLCKFLGKDPWICIPNAAYQQCPSPRISVIISLFNYSEHIYECLESVCASNTESLCGELEVLIVDDCSTDNSANLVEEYISNSNLAMCLVKKVFNTGVSDTRNIGLSLARSPYIFILDADNWIYPHCLTTLYSEIKDSNYAAVYGIINKFSNNTREGTGLTSCYEWNVQELVRGAYIDAMAMFSKKTVLKLGGYSTESIEYGWYGWEDYDLWLKIAQNNFTCKLVPQIVGAYRVHPSSQINITEQYLPTLASYFRKKFSSLVREYKNSLDIIFGMPATTAPELAQLELTELQERLEQAKTTIKLMESNWFWQLRKKWIRLKQAIGLAQEELLDWEIDAQAELQIQLQHAQEMIKAMESSKFWRIRKAWLRFRNIK